MTTAPTSAGQRYLLDTNIISDLMRNPQGSAQRRLSQTLADQATAAVCTSIVVDCEVRFGLHRKQSSKLNQAYADLQTTIEVLPLDASVSPRYAQTRFHLESLGTPIGANDTLIAAHALALNCTLVTDNAAEFMRVPGLRVENWLKPVADAV